MSGVRRLYLDRAPGEARGVVTVDGRPERLLLEREGELCAPEPGQRFVARVRRIDRALGSAFLDLGGATDAILPLGKSGISEGQSLQVEVSGPARRGKGAAARLVAPAEGPPRRLTPGAGLVERLHALAPESELVEGERAREAADAAEAEALAVEHALPGGGSIAIEPTRALVSIDIDVGRAAGGDARRAAVRANQQAIATAARLLRLKGLGGLVVFDLAGGPQDGSVLTAAARAAFAPDMPGVVFGPVSRLGLFQLALPWRATPLADRLRDADGRESPATVALRLARAVEREARHATRVIAVCAPEVAAAAKAIEPALLARLGPRFDIRAEPGHARAEFEIRPA